MKKATLDEEGLGIEQQKTNLWITLELINSSTFPIFQPGYMI